MEKAIGVRVEQRGGGTKRKEKVTVRVKSIKQERGKKTTEKIEGRNEMNSFFVFSFRVFSFEV